MMLVLLLGTQGKRKYILGKASSLTPKEPILNSVYQRYENSFWWVWVALCVLVSALQKAGRVMSELMFVSA